VAIYYTILDNIVYTRSLVAIYYTYAIMEYEDYEDARDYEQSASSLDDFNNPDYYEDDDISHPHSHSERDYTDEGEYEWEEEMGMAYEPEVIGAKGNVGEMLWNVAGYGEFKIMEKAKTYTLQQLRDFVETYVLERVCES